MLMANDCVRAASGRSGRREGCPGGEADVGREIVGEPPHREGRHERVIPRERVRLDRGPMLARRVAVGVDADRVDDPQFLRHRGPRLPVGNWPDPTHRVGPGGWKRVRHGSRLPGPDGANVVESETMVLRSVLFAGVATASVAAT